MDQLTVGFSTYTMGDNVIQKLGDLCQQYGKRVLVIGGKTALAKTKEKINATIEDSKSEIIDFMWYGGECTYQNIKLGSSKVKRTQTDIIIGVGGGKALDTAKGVAEESGLPIITVPTIAATCAATTPISIVYNTSGDFDSFFHLTNPPVHIVIDSQIIANAPTNYLRAGIGDTVAKRYEVEIKSRGDQLAYSSALGKRMSSMCLEPIIKYGVEAVEDCRKNHNSFALEQVILNNIITTGLVSILVKEKYNGACAHALCYGLTLVEEVEENYLHGEIVAYGVLVQLIMDQQNEEFQRVYSLFAELGLPISVADLKIKVDKDYLAAVLKAAVASEDLVDMPYQVTKDMFYKAIKRLENVKKEET
ncbi:iron-containing alcohol dehydrogenase family protein [Halanaerobaculum tunisiense]